MGDFRHRASHKHYREWLVPPCVSSFPSYGVLHMSGQAWECMYKEMREILRFGLLVALVGMEYRAQSAG
jgi:hypothetical protein